MNEFNNIKQCVLGDMSVNYGKLSICDLSNSSGYKGKRKYQVYLETKNRFAENYLSLDDAVNKFLELKETIKPNVY
jgi:hypothetical protein